MLIPITQPGSTLDYAPEAETVTVVVRSDAAINLESLGGRIERVNDHELRLTVAGRGADQRVPITLTVGTPVKSLDLSYHTNRDSRPRALGTQRFLMPFAKPGAQDLVPRTIPEIAGGDWTAGRELFNGKAACASCHELRGDGQRVGPELGNLVHRAYDSVL